MVLLRVIVQLMIMLLVPLRADMFSSLIVTLETVVPELNTDQKGSIKY